MKKTFLYSFLALAFVFQFGFSQRSSLTHFRSTKWGMNKKQVITLEYSDLIEEKNNLLTYEGTVGGYPVFIDYKFTMGKLFEAGYRFNLAHEDFNEYITDYNQLKTVLTEKYGTAGTDGNEWIAQEYAYDGKPELRGEAVAKGFLKFSSSWSSDNTAVTLTLFGATEDNPAAYIVIDYVTISQETEMKRIKKMLKTQGF